MNKRMAILKSIIGAAFFLAALILAMGFAENGLWITTT